MAKHLFKIAGSAILLLSAQVAQASVPADQAANTIVTVLQKGYMIADRLLRPALVTVAQ